jgi:hypothetical protein
MNRGAVARRAAGRRQFTVNKVANPETVQIFAKQRRPALRGQRFVRPRQLERQQRRPHRTPQVNDLRKSMTPIFIDKQVFLESRRSSSRMLGSGSGSMMSRFFASDDGT